MLKSTKWINSFLDTNKLTPPEAAELAGKLLFLSTTMFATGRTAMVCIYGRPHSQTSNTKLTHALIASLRTLLTRCIVFSREVDSNMPIIYADDSSNWETADSHQDAQKNYQRPGLRRQHPQCQTVGGQ